MLVKQCHKQTVWVDWVYHPLKWLMFAIALPTLYLYECIIYINYPINKGVHAEVATPYMVA